MRAKKLLAAAAIVSIMLPGMALAVTERENEDSESEVEHVPTPDFIPFYKNIVRKENALFGQTDMTMEEMKAKIAERQAAKKAEQDAKKTELEKKQSEKKAEQDAKKTELEKKQSEKKLEKIPFPGMIKFFDGIRQEGNALWGFIKDSWGYGLGNLTKDNAACVALAVSDRDGAVRAAIVANNTAMLEAFDARSSCAQTAFAKSTLQEIITGLVACNTDFVKARNTANKDAATAREAAWKKFREDLKKCGSRAKTTLQEASDSTQELLEAIDDQELDDVSQTTEDGSSETEQEGDGEHGTSAD